MSKDNKKFCLSFTFAGGYVASFGPFLVAYFTSLGYTSKESAMFLLLYNVGIIFSFPIIGFLNDNFITMKKSLLILITLSIAVTMIYISTSKTQVILAIYLICISIFQRPILGLLETYTTKISQRYDDVEFGTPRSFASLSYALVTLVMGSAIANYGNHLMFIVQMGFLALLFVSVIFLKNYPLLKDDKEHIEEKEVSSVEQNTFKKAVYDLSRNRNYILLVITAAFLTMSSVCFSTYLSILLEELGGGTKELGISLFIMAIFEIPAMVAFKKIGNRFDLNNILIFSCSVTALKMIIPVIFPSLFSVYLAQVLQSLSYALFVPGIYLAIYKSVKPQNSSFAMSIAITIYSSICSTLAVYFAGLVLDTIGIFMLLILLSISAIIALVVMVIKKVLNIKDLKNGRA
ncbi:MAG: MFS transporter [Lachnospirales bacterium]